MHVNIFFKRVKKKVINSHIPCFFLKEQRLAEWGHQGISKCEKKEESSTLSHPHRELRTQSRHCRPWAEQERNAPQPRNVFERERTFSIGPKARFSQMQACAACTLICSYRHMYFQSQLRAITHKCTHLRVHTHGLPRVYARTD